MSVFEILSQQQNQTNKQPQTQPVPKQSIPPQVLNRKNIAIVPDYDATKQPDVVTTPNDDFQFYCPDRAMVPHIHKVLMGEYEFKMQIENCIILDVGANIGSFTVWAIMRNSSLWTNPTIYCYEPLASNFQTLTTNVKNLAKFVPIDRIHLNNMAVGNPEMTTLFHGVNNIGEASFYNGGNTNPDRQTSTVTTISAADLPFAHILKMDTEGSEVEILKNLKFRPMVVLLEWHGEHRRRQVENLLQDYTLVFSEVTIPGGCGVNKYIQNNYLAAYKSGKSK